jgi:DNA-binding LytR/AlgR family response regulator
MMILGILIDHTFDFEKKWTVKYEFIYFSFFLLIVGIGQFLIRDFIYLIQENWSIKYLVEEVRNTFLVGGFFMCIAIPWNFNYLKNRNQERAAKLDFKRSYPTSSKSIRIKTKVKAETFNLEPEKFLFARAEGNYIDIVIREGDKVYRLLKRLSIKELMDQISEQENNIHQTHRSYVINFGNMNKVTGNAAGYKVLFNQVEEYALVSRSRIPMFEEKLKMLTNDKLNAQTEL